MRLQRPLGVVEGQVVEPAVQKSPQHAQVCDGYGSYLLGAVLVADPQQHPGNLIGVRSAGGAEFSLVELQLQPGNLRHLRHDPPGLGQVELHLLGRGAVAGGLLPADRADVFRHLRHGHRLVAHGPHNRLGFLG